MMTRWMGAVSVVAILIGAASARAQVTSGQVTGLVTFMSLNANFCDASQGQNCSGATYTDANFNTSLPIANAVVDILDNNSNVIGTGATQSNGRFHISWDSAGHPAPTFLTFQWWSIDAGGRYAVNDTNGAPFLFTGTKQIEPQPGDPERDFGKLIWFNNGQANVYAAAQNTVVALLENATLVANLMNVDIRVFYGAGAAGPLGVCPTGCAGIAAGGVPTVQLSTNDKFMNQSRVQHELGHIAGRLLSPRKLIGDYCFPDTGAAGGVCTDSDGDGVTQARSWNLTTPEWGNDGFEEAFATFIGDRVIYGQSATQPTTCISAAACSATASLSQVETSTGNGNVGICPQNNQAMRRSALIIDRYLRDIYDSSNDSSTCAAGTAATCQWTAPSYNDTHHRSFAEMLNVISRFPAGTQNHERNEPFVTGSTTVINDREGFNCDDYMFVYINNGTPVIDTNVDRQFNCFVF